MSHELDEVQRRVEVDGGTERTVVLARTYETSVEDLWDACTNPVRIPRWLAPITGDLEVGGRYQLQGNAGGTIETCDPPHSLRATWEFGGNLSWVELRLSPEGDSRTRLELAHIAPDDDAKWEEFGPGAVGVGWDMALAALGRHLAGEEIPPEEGMAWMASDVGRRFMTLSSERWHDAHLAAGAEPAAAREAADRTTSAYTGAPSPAE
jgi:uncharacterized protein YndB with AHSA1/START domain